MLFSLGHLSTFTQRIQSLLFLAGVFVLLSSCQNEQKAAIQFIPTKCVSGGEPNLHITDSGEAFLTWVEYTNDTTDALVFSKLVDNKWTEPQLIAYGADWFVNWADFPSLATYKGQDDLLLAHWLQKSDNGTYDYDVRLSQSLDGGQNWQPSFVLNQDGIAAEHGFVSLVPFTRNTIFATWLDGRYTKTENDSDGHEHGHGGAMTLRGAFVHPDNSLTEDVELDNKVCDCCQTSAAITENGMIVAYRDRLEGEIRDISVVRQVGQDWTQPRRVFEDNWEITGCPVNGPKIIADGKKVAIAWYTMAHDTAKVKVAFSEDAGATFSTPIRIDEGKPLGRVDIAFAGDNVVASWLEQKANHAEIRLVQVNAAGIAAPSRLISKTSAARSSGFPIMEQYKDQLLFAWTEITDIEEETTVVRSAIVEKTFLSAY